jgi:hypothetical protein
MRKGVAKLFRYRDVSLTANRRYLRVCFFGHHHTRLDSQIDGVPCIGLNKVRILGNLVAIDVPGRGREWTVLGEWPERRP